MKETVSNWACVMDSIGEQTAPVVFDAESSDWMMHDPIHLVHMLSCYKFAAKLIGKNKNVLHLGCHDGLGTFILGMECGFAYGIDENADSIALAKGNFKEKCVQFQMQDLKCMPIEETQWDAIVYLGSAHSINPESGDAFFTSACNHLKPEGLLLVCIEKERASNVLHPQSLEEMMREFFHCVFLFGMHDDMSFISSGRYYIASGCKKKQ